jgi:aminoglycoside phosphotransferase (APT) family kinase protein
LQPILDSLQRSRVKDSELVCTHGDFSPRNVLVCDQRALLVDWDRLQQADPARDVTYFATWSWREAIRHGRLPDRSGLKAAVECYQAARPGSDLQRQLPFHVAAGLVRMCCSLIELWPDQAYLVPGLARAALRELEKGR